MRCESCNKILDAHSPMKHFDPPKPGDVSVCGYCAMISVFTEDFNLRKMTRSEIDKFKIDQPDDWAIVHQAAVYITDQLLAAAIKTT